VTTPGVTMSDDRGVAKNDEGGSFTLTIYTTSNQAVEKAAIKKIRGGLRATSALHLPARSLFSFAVHRSPLLVNPSFTLINSFSYPLP
jgi:hypothetical protein